jgi:hypothetical protein
MLAATSSLGNPVQPTLAANSWIFHVTLDIPTVHNNIAVDILLVED